MTVIEWTPILQAFLALCVAVITAGVLPWLRAKCGAEELETALTWVEVAVQAAEQYCKSSTGAKKKEWVLYFLEQHGVRLDPEEMEMAIESAVLDLHKAVKSEC